jgi:hypothetical protein
VFWGLIGGKPSLTFLPTTGIDVERCVHSTCNSIAFYRAATRGFTCRKATCFCYKFPIDEVLYQKIAFILGIGILWSRQMAMKFRIEVRAEWRSGGKSYSQNSLIYCIAAGQSQIDWQSEKVRSVDEFKKFVDALTTAKGMTILIESHYAAMLFPNHRDVDFVSMQVKDWSPSSGDGVLITITCKDLKVTQVMPLTAHLVDLAKSKGVTLDMDVNRTMVVSMTTKQKFIGG